MKKILIALGVLAVIGIAVYFFKKKKTNPDAVIIPDSMKPAPGTLLTGSPTEIRSGATKIY